MKQLIAALLLFPLLALAGPSDIVTNQRNTTDTGTIPRTVAKPVGTLDGVMGFNGATQLPVHWTLGSGLTQNSGALTVLPPSWTSITGKPSLAPVATSGSYDDLAGKPALFSGAYSALTGVPTSFTPTAHTHAASDITSGTLPDARISALPISKTTGLQTALDSKFNLPTGTQAQYIRGDGTLATLPAARRIETYTGTTNAQGQIVVTYSSPYPAVPNVQTPPPASSNQVWTLTSSTTTGFTVALAQRNVATLLGLEVLLGAVVPVPNVSASILVVAQ